MKALVTWLMSQPDTKKKFDDFGKVETRESDSVIDASDLHADSVEQVFARAYQQLRYAPQTLVAGHELSTFAMKTSTAAGCCHRRGRAA